MSDRMDTAKKPRVMICVITFRRPSQLKRLLEALGRQSRAGLDVVVTVVDNDSAGSAAGVCDELCSAGGLPLQYRIEPEPGIVSARNRCASEFLASDCELMAFIDDDEWPETETWLEDLVRCCERNAADIVAADVISAPGSEVPTWATEILYGRSNRAEGEEVAVFYTGNLLLTRGVLETLNPPFDMRFALTGASDYHFALRCSRAGFRAVHALAPVVEEFPKERATLPWFLRRGFRSGSGHTRSHLIEERVWTAAPRCLVLAGGRLVQGACLAAAGAVTMSRTRWVRGLFKMSSAVGSVAGLAGITHHEYRQLHH